MRREVMAHNIKQAMSKDGKIYSIEEAVETAQPNTKSNNEIGFKNKK